MQNSKLYLASLLLIVLTSACTSTPERSASSAADLERVFFTEKLKEMDHVILGNISSNRIPGGVLWFEREKAAYHKSYGNRAVAPAVEPMTEDTIFDAASLTKVVATTPAIMILVERNQLQLDAPVARYIPGFAGAERDGITVRHLLTHTSGLRAGISSTPSWQGYEAAIQRACGEKPTATSGSIFRYSDINFILLGEIVRQVSGQALDVFTAQEIFAPLGMKNTMFKPSEALHARIAPTERVGTNILRGVVHDPTARRMGGVAGHAGLFTTAADLAVFARCLLNEGQLGGKRILKPETVRLMTSVQTPEALTTRRALGWDIDSAYAGPRGKHYPVGSYGHTGWTGTSLWIDPFSRSFIIFLSNRNHPDESGSVLPLRARLGTLATEAIRDFNFTYVPGALKPLPSATGTSRGALATTAVLNGIDVMKRDNFKALKGLKVGLITNHTGTDRERNSIIDLLHEAADVNLVALFSPEHGIRGLLDEKVSDSVDDKTGLPIYSLYGERRTPAPEQLRDLDALVFDIQDIGCRFYTYISTMGNCMEAAAKAGKKYFVLDRVNPINGVTIEGPILKGEPSFTGWHTIPLRHAMTVGELARMFNEEKEIKADLTVIPVEGWKREFFFDQTSLPWINPSPNMRNLTEAVLYPGVGLLETTALSVGRGTDTPFEVIGAPYIDDLRLAHELNEAGLPQVRFVPIRFTPTSSVYKGQLCKGVNIILLDRTANVVEIGIQIALKLQQLYPNEFGLEKFNRLLVHPPTIEAIRSGKPLDQIKTSWNAELNDFKARREKYLMYR